MKIGILTFQDALNYGAALQAYALKKTMDKYGICDIINYYNPHIHLSETKKKKSLGDYLHIIKKRKRKKNFKKFQAEYMSLGKVIDRDNIYKLRDLFDLFITGSDQVWNLDCSGNDKTYFFDFIEDKRKKNSYAASFGSNDIADEKLYSILLKDFNNISVREKSGKEIIKRILQKDVSIVLDPTLLLSKEEWYQVFDLEDKEEYILIYEVLNGKDIEKYAKILAQQTGLKIICLTCSNRLRTGMKVVRDAGPIEWMKYFSKAKYILTNSFHGTAFSIIFKKQFFIELLPPPANTNTRMLEVVNMFGLSERIIKDEAALFEKNINYEEVSIRIEELKSISMRYIKNMVEVK